MSLMEDNTTENNTPLISTKQLDAQNSSTNSKLKFRCRKEDIVWTLEEEYIFFETHLFLGNKWTKYSSLFKDKTPKDLKNHFHACIIKTVRRIINNKFDCELKDIMRCFYAFNYLMSMFAKMNNQKKNQKRKMVVRNKYKFNPKFLIKTKQLLPENIKEYSEELTKKILLKKPGIMKFLRYIEYCNDLNIEKIRWLFSVIIKCRLVKKCKNLLLENSIKDTTSIGLLCNYIRDNSYFTYLENTCFNE